MEPQRRGLASRLSLCTARARGGVQGANALSVGLHRQQPSDAILLAGEGHVAVVVGDDRVKPVLPDL